ncbi:MAG: Gp37 family protein [Ahrensia sp.]|nr:Gp37 family protein [Ahrensia sp.]
MLLIRQLRGHTGAYHALEDARLALQGKAFAGAGPAEIISDALVAESQGQWRFKL